MATVIRAEISEKNKYWIDKHRHYELKHFCLQYPSWKKAYADFDDTSISLSTIERLLDMDVERYLLASALEGIISQKLARKLCDKCKKMRPTTKYERYMFARVLHKKVREIYEPVGCDDCHGGFTGRIAIHEVLYISEKLSDLIADARIEKDELRDEVLKWKLGFHRVGLI